MPLNMKKCCKAATVSAMVIAGLGIFGPLLAGSLPAELQYLKLWIGLALFASFVAVLSWAGFKAVRGGMGMSHGTAAGALAGFAGSLLSGAVNLAVVLPVTLPAMVSQGRAAPGVEGLITFGAVIATAFGVAFWLVAGMVCGAAGGYLASRARKSEAKRVQPRKSAPKRR